MTTEVKTRKELIDSALENAGWNANDPVIDSASTKQ
jgi:type I site-specific restriction endonuclease